VVDHYIRVCVLESHDTTTQLTDTQPPLARPTTPTLRHVDKGQYNRHSGRSTEIMSSMTSNHGSKNQTSPDQLRCCHSMGTSTPPHLASFSARGSPWPSPLPRTSHVPAACVCPILPEHPFPGAAHAAQWLAVVWWQ
jgi:hypothetical protein